MGAEQAQFLVQTTLWTMLLLSLPVLGIVAVVSFAFSIFQAVTQIQDQTLPFVLKFATIVIVLSVFGAWIFGEISSLFVSALTFADRDTLPF